MLSPIRSTPAGGTLRVLQGSFGTGQNSTTRYSKSWRSNETAANASMATSNSRACSNFRRQISQREPRAGLSLQPLATVGFNVQNTQNPSGAYPPRILLHKKDPSQRDIDAICRHGQVFDGTKEQWAKLKHVICIQSNRKRSPTLPQLPTAEN